MIMQIILTNLLNIRVKPFVTSQLTALVDAMTGKMKTIWTSKMITLTTIQADQTNRVID